MSESGLTCQETPLAWTSSVDISSLEVCTMCGMHLNAPQSGSLQVLTRRQGDGVGDGVNIDESSSISADYRGQRYLFEEAILHVPGLHVFPGQKEPYSAEYHIHLRTLTEPQRFLTIVIPATHKKEAVSANDKGAGSTYFAAISSKPVPGAERPTLTSLVPVGTEYIQYVGPDIRGRTRSPASVCADQPEDRQFLLMLHVASIRATDLERIPREGSLSSDPRDLPAPGAKPTATVSRERLLKMAILARPGVLKAEQPPTKAAPRIEQELTCKPIRIEDGEVVVDLSGEKVPVAGLMAPKQILGSATLEKPSDRPGPTQMLVLVLVAVACVALLDYLFSFIWRWFFTAESYPTIAPRTLTLYKLKLALLLIIMIGIYY